MTLLKLVSLLLNLTGLVTARRLGHHDSTVAKDRDLVSKAFKPREEIKLVSPIFLNQSVVQDGFLNGTQAPMSHEDMEAFLKRVVRSSVYMTYNTTSFTSEEGRSIPFIRIASDKYNARLRVWIQGGVYGDEPASDESIYALLASMVTRPEWLDKMTEKIEVLVLPRYNPDGVFHFRPRLGNGTESSIDPDRDHLQLLSNHTRNIKKMYNEFDPHIAVDMHEYNGTGLFSVGQYQQGADILYATGNNLGISEGIRLLAEDFAWDIEDALEEKNIRFGFYYEDGVTDRHEDFVGNFTGADSSAGIGRNAMGLTQTLSYMIATRGLYLGNQYFQRRVATGMFAMQAILDIATEKYDRIYHQIEEARKQFGSSRKGIALTDYSQPVREEFPWVQTKDGSVVYKNANLNSTNPPIANLTRYRPEAYLIPANASAGVIDRLETLGLKITTYKEHTEECVQVLDFISDPPPEEFRGLGYRHDNIVTRYHAADLNITEGTFSVSTRQKNGALAIVALEPENIDSFVSWNIIPGWKGSPGWKSREYPIFGKMRPEYCADL